MEPDSVGKVVGENHQRIRIHKGLSQVEAAAHLQEEGVPWKRANIAALESGKRKSVSIEELVMLSYAYHQPLTSWFAGEGEFQLAPGVMTTRAAMRELVSGGKRPGVMPFIVDFSKDVRLPADESIALRLGIDDLSKVTDAADDLWGHTATAERDRRLAAEMPDADPASLRTLRSAMTKRLYGEIKQHIEGDADN